MFVRGVHNANKTALEEGYESKIEGKVKYDDTAPVLVVYQILEIIKAERQVKGLHHFILS